MGWLVRLIHSVLDSITHFCGFRTQHAVNFQEYLRIRETKYSIDDSMTQQIHMNKKDWRKKKKDWREITLKQHIFLRGDIMYIYIQRENIYIIITSQGINAFELWCWMRLLRVPWTARRSNQSILKVISPEYSLKGLMLKLKLQYFGHLMGRTDVLKKTDAAKD